MEAMTVTLGVFECPCTGTEQQLLPWGRSHFSMRVLYDPYTQ